MTIIPQGILRLEGLYELDQKGIDIRPTLLRVLTDQYVSSPHHTPEEERQYTELAMRLLDETDIATRAAVSARLARHPAAPRPIILQLARDVLEVAEPILKHAAGLTPVDCNAIVYERGPSYADIIAERGKEPDVGEPLVRPVQAPTPVIATPVADRAHEPLCELPVRPRHDAMWDPVLTANAIAGADAAELCELFFAAGSPERRLILIMLDYAAADPLPPRSILQRADIWRIESAALTHSAGAVVREFEQALGVSATLARRIVNDELGEPIAVAAKAMQLPNDVVERMLLFMLPTVGQSVDRVYELTNLYGEISVDAARRLVSIWCEAAQAEPVQEAAADTTVWGDVVDNARRALSEISRPQAPRRDTLSVQVGSAQPRSGRR